MSEIQERYRNNILKSQERYQLLENVNPEIIYTGAIELLPGGRVTDLILLVFCILVGFVRCGVVSMYVPIQSVFGFIRRPWKIDIAIIGIAIFAAHVISYISKKTRNTASTIIVSVVMQLVFACVLFSGIKII